MLHVLPCPAQRIRARTSDVCVCVFWGVVEDLHFGVAGYQLFPLGNYEEPQRIEAFIMLLFYKEHVELCHT